MEKDDKEFTIEDEEKSENESGNEESVADDSKSEISEPGPSASKFTSNVILLQKRVFKTILQRFPFLKTCKRYIIETFQKLTMITTPQSSSQRSVTEHTAILLPTLLFDQKQMVLIATKLASTCH